MISKKDRETKEKTVEEKLREGVKEIGGKAFKLSSQVDAGMPDRLVCFPGGKVIFVETKRPKGGALSKIQKYRHQQLRKMGLDVRVINTAELVKAFIEEQKGGDAE